MKTSIYLGVILSATLSFGANAAIVIDQSFIPVIYPETVMEIGTYIETDNNVTTNDFLQAAQTVTVGRAGTLDSIAVFVQRLTSEQDAGALTVEIRPTVGNRPDSNDLSVLASVDVSADQFQQTDHSLVGVDLSIFDLHFDAGDTFAIVLIANENVPFYFGYQWSGYGSRRPDAYTGGDAYGRVSSTYPEWAGWEHSEDAHADMGFSTFMNVSAVPIPAAAWLFGSALAALFGVGRMRKQAD